MSHDVAKEAVTPYVKLAQAIVCAAVREFLAEPSPSLLGPEQLEIVTHARQAGEFLLERRDRITRYWFTLMGTDLDALRSTPEHPAHLARLADLRLREIAMRTVVRKRVA